MSRALVGAPASARVQEGCARSRGARAHIVERISETRSRMRALDWARAGIKTAQLNDSSRSANIYIYFLFFFLIANWLRYGHKQTLSINYNI